MTEEQVQKQKMEDNVIYVGRKPSMAYVLGVITQFSDGQKEVHIKARGKSISRAVDVAEIVRRKFMNDLQIKNIAISTEERELEDKTKLNVSTISITLAK
jgi:DNA-binding protein